MSRRKSSSAATAPAIRLVALGESAVVTPVCRIEPSAEVLFAAAVYLILERREPVTRQSMQELLWPMQPARVASHRMRQTLLTLRKAGIPVVRVGRNQLGMGSADVSVDFEEFLDTRQGIRAGASDALVLLPGFEPRFSEPYLEWLDARKSAVAASVTRVMLGIIARHRVQAEWADVELNATHLLRFQPYNEEATLAMAEACAMRGAKLEAMRTLDRYLNDVGRGPTDIRLPATIMRRRIADRMPPRAEAFGKDSPFVGRGPMMRDLGELLGRARNRQGQACLVWGEAGVGKSRLLSEFSTFAALQGVATQRMQCRPNDLHRPLSVFVDLIPPLRSMRGAIGCSAETIKYLDKLTRHRPTTIEIRADEGDSEFVYARVQQSLFDLVDAVSEEGCLIVLVEDVHWIDQTSAKVLREMVAWSAGHSILFAFTGRDEPEGWLTGMPDQLRTLYLPPLDPDASRDVVLGLVRQQGREISADYLEWCVRVAEGNPYFLQELANQWLETGEEQKVPRSLTAVLNDRVSRLDRDALQLLQACSVLEKNSTLARVESVLQYEPYQLLRSMTALSGAGMLVVEKSESGHAAPDNFAPRHDLLANVALARLGAPALAFLHRRAGLILESEIDGSGSAAILWDCAKHWQQAGDAGRALGLGRSCATHLMEVGLPSAAAEAYEKTLAYCSTLQERLEILEGQAHAYYRSSSWAKVTEVVATAKDVRRRMNVDVDLHDELELMDMRAEWRTLRLDVTMRKALQCLAAASANTEHRVDAGTMALMLLDLMCCRREMEDVYAKVKTLSEDPKVSAGSRLQAQLVYHTACGEIETAVRAARCLVPEQKLNGNIGDEFRALCNSAVVFRTAGLFDEAKSSLLQALEIAQAHKIQLSMTRALPMLANMALERGERDEAAQWTEQLLSIADVDDKHTALEIAGLRTRIALIDNDLRAIRRFMPRSLRSIRIDPIFQRRTYHAALHVAGQLAADRVSPDTLSLLEEAHLRSRGNIHQAFAAFTLCAALRRTGRKRDAGQLLNEYETKYRREPWPAPIHLMKDLERLGRH